MQLLTERDDAERNLSTFAAQVLSAPHKAGLDGNDRQAVEDIILLMWRNELQSRRIQVEQQLQTTSDESTHADLTAQLAQLTTDIKRLTRWKTGEAILKLYI